MSAHAQMEAVDPVTHTKKVEKDFLEKISMHVTNMEWAAKHCRHLADELTNMARYHTKLAVELRSLKQTKKTIVRRIKDRRKRARGQAGAASFMLHASGKGS